MIKNILLSIEKNSEVMKIENERLCLSIPDLMGEREHSDIEDSTVKSILIDFSKFC